MIRSDMHDYQNYTVKRIIEEPQVGLFLKMGLGKTVSALTAIWDLKYDYFDINKALVIAPLRIAETVWSEEIEKWEHLHGLKLSKVLGSEKDRIAALKVDADAYIINRENVVWLVEYLKGAKWPFQMLVIDESTSFKNPSSCRFKALRRVFKSFDRRVLMTGTPSPQGLIDLWPQVYLLDEGSRLEKTVTGYRGRYFYPAMSNGHVVYKWALKPESEAAIHNRISDITVSMSTEDYLKMPPISYNRLVTEIDLKEYRKFEKDQILKLPDGIITAVNAAVLSGKLLQYCSGAIYDKDGNVKDLHGAKLAVLEELTEPGDPLLVFYNYKHSLTRIKEKFPNAVELKSEKQIKDWNAGKIQMMLAHPASAGHGLNLQAGGCTMVWFDLTFNLEQYQQAVARLYRQGQQHGVIVHHIVIKGTIDELALRVLDGKAKTQDALMDYLKAKISSMHDDKYLL